MSTYELRPRFQIQVPFERQEIVSRFKAAFAHEDKEVVGSAMVQHVILKIPASKRHYWSPQLDLNLEEQDGGTYVRGLLGPRPAVWAMFSFGYAVLGLAVLVGFIIGFAQWAMNESATMLWLIPIGLLLGALEYFIARTGRKLGYNEMVILYNFAMHTLDREDKVKGES